MEETMQGKEDLQVTGELKLLSKAVENILGKAGELEGRLKKIMMASPTTDEEAKQPELQLCDVAQQIHDARCGAWKVQQVLDYILDNLQL